MILLAEKEIPSVSIIVPTYNEKDNLPDLVKNIFSVVKKDKFDLEIVIVDDNSPDGTGDVARKLGEKYSLQLVTRPEKSGLSSAVLDGIKSAKGDIIGVMDGDLSHDPVIIPKMIDAIARQKNQLVVGSRYIKGGKIENWPLARRIISWVAVLIAFPFTGVKDRTSGYFFFKRDILDGVTLDPRGFKIGLEIMVKGNYKRWKEIPYTFKNRTTGKSKMNCDEVKHYLSQLRSYIFYKKQLTTKD